MPPVSDLSDARLRVLLFGLSHDLQLSHRKLRHEEEAKVPRLWNEEAREADLDVRHFEGPW